MVIVGLSFVFTQPCRYGYDFKMSFKPFQTCLHKNFTKIRIRKMLIWLISPLMPCAQSTVKLCTQVITLCQLAPKKHLACPDV